MINKKSRKYIIAGLLLIAAALFITVFNLFDAQRAQASVRNVISQFDAVIYEAGVIPEYVLDPYMEMPTVLVEGAEYVGKLEIPSLGLSLPVAAELSSSQLRKSPCCYTGSAYLNNMVIAAHNYSSHFGKLEEIKPGEKVIFTDVTGNRFSYVAAVRETLEPTEIEEMISGNWDLTLFTCTFGGQARVAVRCVGE